uniref:Uncharacterized protein AlNc14C168G7935 n=1 Tax=Albugo laibachii Nc14 TaxID=890382 RepID=F0WNA3_9STRA|nr:conserved hypothetical protein [Albugo laibachii Nc14]|eukprot:CCA22792.1 conserved hypothetical protein [Albugo laibachii Nc14]
MKSYNKTNTAPFDILKRDARSRTYEMWGDLQKPIKSFFQFKSQQAGQKIVNKNEEKLDAIASAVSTCSARLIDDVEHASNSFELIEILRSLAQEVTMSEDSHRHWTLKTKVRDVEIYQTAPPNSANKLVFRMSCNMNANILDVLDYLTPCDTKSYQMLESKVFPGYLQASVLQNIEFPPQLNCSFPTLSENKFPRANIKWLANRMQNMSPEALDFCFMEYATLPTLSSPIGFHYFHSLSDHLTSQVLSTLPVTEQNLLTALIAKCERAVIQNGFHLVLPSEQQRESCQVICSMTIDFQGPLHEEMARKVVIAYANRLMNIREQIVGEDLDKFILDTTIDCSDWDQTYRGDSQQKHPFGPHDNNLDQFDLQTASESCLASRKKATHCSFCHTSFSILKLRKYCRSCCRAVCSRCGKKWTYCEQPVRLCLLCLSKARHPTGGGIAESPQIQGLSARDHFSSNTREVELPLTPAPPGSTEHDIDKATSIKRESSIRIASALSYDVDEL